MLWGTLTYFAGSTASVNHGQDQQRNLETKVAEQSATRHEIQLSGLQTKEMHDASAYYI
jgi:hypothetical protein